MKKTPTLATLAILITAFLCISSSAFAQSLDKTKLGRSYGGWTKKGNSAAEFRTQNSNYRIYKPDASKRFFGGLYVTTTLDHIRGWGHDDHAKVDLWFNSKGVVTKYRVKVTPHNGREWISKDLVDTSGAAATAAGADPRIAAIASFAASLSKKLNKQFDDWGEHGGSAYFQSVIQHAANRIATNVK